MIFMKWFGIGVLMTLLSAWTFAILVPNSIIGVPLSVLSGGYLGYWSIKNYFRETRNEEDN